MEHQQLPPASSRPDDFFYRKALNVSQAIYPLQTDTTTAILLNWVENPKRGVSEQWAAGVWYAVWSSFSLFVLMMPLSLLLAFHGEQVHAKERKDIRRKTAIGGY